MNEIMDLQLITWAIASATGIFGYIDINKLGDDINSANIRDDFLAP